MSQVTKCGELCDRVDLASQVYTKGSHLLCHDDVIGTRKARFAGLWLGSELFGGSKRGFEAHLSRF